MDEFAEQKLQEWNLAIGGGSIRPIIGPDTNWPHTEKKNSTIQT